LMHYLAAEAAYRYSKYNGGVKTNTYKFGGSWAPVADIRLRASFQHAVRAPNVIELFSPQNRQTSLQLPVNANGRFDPCSGPTPAATLAQCANTGVTAAQYGTIADNNFFGNLTGGNPGLKPESSDTYSFGAVLQPRFVPNFTISVDYFKIGIDNLIGTVNPVLALPKCLTTGDAYFCSLIHRGQGGTLHATNDAFFINTNVNTGSLKTSGIDFTVDYRTSLNDIFKTDAGSLGINFVGTQLRKFLIKPLPSSTAAESYDCSGLYGFLCAGPRPTWRHTVRLNWETPWSVGITTSWRHVSRVTISRASSQAALAGTFAVADKYLGTQNYFDLALSWKIKKDITFRTGINNILDRDPPVTSQLDAVSGGNGNTYPNFYDPLGRYLFANLTVGF
jgi:iron complex outermembrane recepter protein